MYFKVFVRVLFNIFTVTIVEELGNVFEEIIKIIDYTVYDYIYGEIFDLMCIISVIFISIVEHLSNYTL